MSTIIRVTSDCPLIDDRIVAAGVEEYKKQGPGTYYSNAIIRTYPRGMDYEIFSFDMLKDAYDHATDEGDKEHVTPYIWKNRSGKVNIRHDIAGEDNSNFRITLDTVEDQILITKLIEEHKASELDCNAIVKILKNNPGLSEINKFIEQKKV